MGRRIIGEADCHCSDTIVNIVRIMICHLIERYATTLKIGPNKIQIKYTGRMKKKKERMKKK